MKMKLPILIIGMGKSGQAALRLMELLKVPKEQIKTFDSKLSGVDFSKPEEILSFKPAGLLVSPGISLKTPWIENLISSGCELSSELDLACQYLKDEKVIGVTGSMGKSTTTSLLAAAATAFDPTCFAGGNLGFPLADYISDVLEEKRPRAKWVILELSSYQLENCQSLKAEASVLTALSPNHLERYSSLDDYYSTKWTLKDKTLGPFFLNACNAEMKNWCARRQDQQCKWVSPDDSTFKDYDFNSSKLVGSHNRQNLALAAAVAQYFGWPESAFKAMTNYRGLAHRLELIMVKNQVTFINDSKATTVESVLAAVESCLNLVQENARMHLLVGGRDKNLPWEQLGALKNQPRLEVYFFGEVGEQAQKRSTLKGGLHPSLNLALKSLENNLNNKDWVVLSPGGSSLDEFKNFEERGEFFKSWVHSL